MENPTKIGSENRKKNESTATEMTTIPMIKIVTETISEDENMSSENLNGTNNELPLKTGSLSRNGTQVSKNGTDSEHSKSNDSKSHVNQNETSGSSELLITTSDPSTVLPESDNVTEIHLEDKNFTSSLGQELKRKNNLHPKTESDLEEPSTEVSSTENIQKMQIQMPAEVSLDFDADRSPMLKILISVNKIDKLCNESTMINSDETNQN